jgi:acetylornithine deacetylase/succinyl-diaminopimelate desuccinylase-like protein
LLSRGFYLTVAAVLVAAAAVLIGMWFVQKPTAEDSVYVPKKEVITPEITLLQQYVRIDTSNPPGREGAGARFLVDQFERAGIRAELIESAPGRANVYARIRGSRPGEGLLLLHHIDVVPSDGKGWTRPPFAAEIHLNNLYGRGALDMKSIGIAQLLAFIDVAKSGVTPKRDLVFLASADEEEGSEQGIEWLLEHRPDIFEGVKYALNEGGITEIVREKLVYFAVEIGSKQMVTLEARAPDRESLRLARLALEPRFESRDPERISPAVNEYFRAIVPVRKSGTGILSDAGRAVAEGKVWNLEPAYRALTQNQIIMSGPEKRGGVYVADVSLVNLPEEDPAAVIGKFRDAVAPYGVEVGVIRKMGPTAVSSPRTPLFSLIETQVKTSYGDQARIGPFFPPDVTTDSRYLRARGIVSYGLWPFPVDFFQSTGIHGADERIRLDWFVAGVGFMKALVMDALAREAL